VYGTISSVWSNAHGVFDYTIIVPPNSQATVYLPAFGFTGTTVNEGSTMIWKAGAKSKSARGVTFNNRESDFTVWDIGSGTYHFVVRYSG
jgi:hypothetical protein